MHYKTNRLNHDFQIVHFLAGSCHTADAAYALLCDLREDRSNALKSSEAGRLRNEAKRVRAARDMKSDDEAVRLEGQADLAEIEAMAETTQKNIDAAKAEIATIDACMARLEPHRKYKHLPLPQAHEAAQLEEWKLELIRRAENCLLTTGTISTDEFATMRLHPLFEAEIWPAINELRQLMNEPDGQRKILDHMSNRTVNLPKLLEPPTKK